MRRGLAPRLLTSHLLLVALALSVFVAVVLTVTERQAAAAGIEADRTTAAQLAPWIARFYRERGSWEGLVALLDDARIAPQMPMMPRPAMGRRLLDIGGGRLPRVDQPILVLSRSGDVLVARGVSDRHVQARRVEPDRGVPIGETGRPVGYLFLGAMANPESNPLRAVFVRTSRIAALVTALVVLAAAAGAALLWTRWLVRPLKELSAAAGAMAGGDYRTRVSVAGRDDEISQLADSFNDMAFRIDAQEQSRRRFVADAAHELRTPLSLISARVDLLESGVYTADAAQWTALRGGIGRMERLVDDLQTLARLDAGRLDLRLVPGDIAGVVGSVVAAFEPAAAEIDVRIESDLSPCTVRMDAGRLEQVFTNIVGNALRHSPSGGVVRVGIDRTDSDRVAVFVEDDGPGVPVADRQRIFDRFVRLDDSRGRASGGSGLGLAIAAEIVRLHDGTIHVADAESGRGARFVIELPAAVVA
ncbi:MAG: sensor histidine kinase [Spirochaetaceae bacterium]|nr:MAG: sensor histidine kinase [Spirochaetaceae bacterium]